MARNRKSAAVAVEAQPDELVRVQEQVAAVAEEMRTMPDATSGRRLTARELALVPEIIKAVRSDRKIGAGSCSSIDECYSDDELIETLKSRFVTRFPDSAEGAVKYFYKLEGLYWTQVNDARAEGGLEPIK